MADVFFKYKTNLSGISCIVAGMRTSVNTCKKYTDPHERCLHIVSRSHPNTQCCTHLVKNGVTHTEDVHNYWILQQRQEMVRHALPEMKQEVLDLKHIYDRTFEPSDIRAKWIILLNGKIVPPQS